MCFSTKEIFLSINNNEKNLVKNCLKNNQIELDENIKRYFAVYKDNNMAGCGGYVDNTIRSFAIEEEYKGSNAIGVLISRILEEMNAENINDIFLFTKPISSKSFGYLGFYEIASTDFAVLMENNPYNIKKFQERLESHKVKTTNNGAVVMNCNPFTKGHRYLIERALKECEHLFVFLVEEDKSAFPLSVRFNLVKEGIKDLKNITLIKGGNYIISSATFPNYFLKDKSKVTIAQAELDAEIFASRIAPVLNIKKRFVGNEPYCQTTNDYNNSLRHILKKHNIELKEIERIKFKQETISASIVRDLIKREQMDELKNFLPQSTLDFLQSEKILFEEIKEKIKLKGQRH